MLKTKIRLIKKTSCFYPRKIYENRIEVNKERANLMRLTSTLNTPLSQHSQNTKINIGTMNVTSQQNTTKNKSLKFIALQTILNYAYLLVKKPFCKCNHFVSELLKIISAFSFVILFYFQFFRHCSRN